MAKPISPQIETLTLSARPRLDQGVEQWLQCNLFPDTTILLPMANLVEVAKIPPGQITPISHLPPWVMGVYNWRGEILWLVDLSHLVGLSPWATVGLSASYHTAVVIEGPCQPVDVPSRLPQRVGLVVRQVDDIEWLNPSDIHSPPAASITTAMAPFLRGLWLNSRSDLLTVLDSSAILSRLPG